MSINEIRIGQYRFSKNLGNGSFGKVKSKLNVIIYPSGRPGGLIRPIHCQNLNFWIVDSRNQLRI